MHVVPVVVIAYYVYFVVIVIDKAAAVSNKIVYTVSNSRLLPRRSPPSVEFFMNYNALNLSTSERAPPFPYFPTKGLQIFHEYI